MRVSSVGGNEYYNTLVPAYGKHPVNNAKLYFLHIYIVFVAKLCFSHYSEFLGKKKQNVLIYYMNIYLCI